MPHILALQENAIFIVCEHEANVTGKKNRKEVELAQQMQQETCARCGYHRDWVLKNQDRQAQAKQPINLMCIHPNSPYLPELKKQLGIEG